MSMEEIEAKWRADEEARMKAMGLSSEDADPWENSNSENKDEEETKDEATDSGPITVDLEEVQRKARKEAAAQIAAAEKAERDAADKKEKQREAERKEQRQREALGDAGSNVDPDFLTALIKGGLGFQGILELLREMNVVTAKDLQSVKYQDLVDSGLKPIQARKLKAIGMRSGQRASTPKQVQRPVQTPPHAAGSGRGSRVPDQNRNVTPESELKKKKSSSMFKRLTKAFGTGGSSNAAAFAADVEEQEGPTTDDLFEEGTQRYFKVERRVNNGEFTWSDLPAGLSKEMNEVRDLWQLAADRGHPKAWHNLGYIYENGSGMVRDAKKAVQCWTKAAEYGDMDAQYNLGVMYAKGRGVDRNEAKAVELLTLAADKGDANAQLNLGIMYAKGRGVDKDETKAFQLWEKAAEQGHASAQYNLGAMYATGRGVVKDLERAVHLYHQAATQGVVQAQYSLGLMYQYGKSVEQSNDMAKELFTRAAQQGHAKAKQHLDQLTELEGDS